MSASRVVVTGASGFVGRALCARLEAGGLVVYRALRRRGKQQREFENSVVVGDINSHTDWSGALSERVDVVVHLAARVHVLRDSADDPLMEFRKVNVDGTLRLAREAAAAGVRRFVFISSIGVNGAETSAKPFTAEDPAAPHSPYAYSKYEAEVGLKTIARETGLEVVIIRPPLVYGPGAPGNFGSLLRWVYKGIPLPLGAINNRRSLVALGNLVDFIDTCISHSAAANQVFLVADNEDISTTELLRRVGGALGVPVRLFPVPTWVLEAGAAVVGQGAMARRLCRSLQLDISKTRDVLGWEPPVGVDQALSETATFFLRAHNK